MNEDDPDAGTSTPVCLLPGCSKDGPLKAFKAAGIAKLGVAANDRDDKVVQNIVKAVIKAKRDCVLLHSACYCSYTSSRNIESAQKELKRKCDADAATAIEPKVKRSDVPKFNIRTPMFLLRKITCV